MRKKGLGRGLGALMSNSAASGAAGATGAEAAAELSAMANPTLSEPKGDGSLAEINVANIGPSRFQPRREFDEEALNELASSIKTQGLMQPVVVRARTGGRFELIAGERRWRASKLAGLDKIPALVREVSDEQASAMALIENIQREDLNPLEEAMALNRLKDEFELTQQQVADTVGKSRVAVTNLLRLLNLAPKVRDMLANGDLEMGHARALLSLDAHNQEKAALEVIERQLSVRQTEALARQWLQPKPVVEKPAGPDPDTAALERRLSDNIGAPVQIRQDAKGRGQLVIKYTSLDELDGILRHLPQSD